MQIPKPPSKATLKKYGNTHDEWIALALSQGNVCAICKKLPETGKLVQDHLHIKNYKKLSSKERKKYLRGLLCVYCNLRLLPKGMTLEKARNLVAYLEAFENKLNHLCGLFCIAYGCQR